MAQRSRESPATDTGRDRSRRWTPLLVIAVIYLVAVGVNEWRLQQRVADLRSPAPLVEPVVGEGPLEPVAAAG